MSNVLARARNMFLRSCAVCAIVALCLQASGQEPARAFIKVPHGAWQDLSSPERDAIQRRYIVEVLDPSSYGSIIDNQGANESSSGSNAGSNLGGAIGNAAYIDNAIKGGNYSAKGQLAAGLLGAIIGSALDSKPEARYRFRYAIKMGNGDVGYFDEVKQEPFRHPVGLCVSVPSLKLIDQKVCTQTSAGLRASLLDVPAERPREVAVRQAQEAAVGAAQVERPAVAASGVEAPLALVNCKFGTLAPVRTSAEKCSLINGVQVP